MDWLFGKITDLSCEQYKAVYSTLTASRKAHIDRLKHQEDKLRSLMATHLINSILQSRSIFDARLENGADNKPYLSNSNLFVSISHCEQAVICVVSDHPVGIDLEKIRPVKKALIDYVCTQKEKAFVFEGTTQPNTDIVTDKQTLINFFEIWTAKEALFKNNGSGIRSTNVLPLKKQHFTVDDFLVTII